MVSVGSLMLSAFNGPDIALGGLWAFLSIGAIALFAIFLPAVTWMDSRRKEREAFYKADTMRRITESSADGAKAAMDLMQFEYRMEQVRKREGMKIGGVVTLAVGIALTIFLKAAAGSDRDAPYLVGLIPALVGVALLVYVFLMAPKVE